MMCVCAIHSNFINLVDAIHKYTQEFPQDHQVLLSHLVCNKTFKNCMLNTCSDYPTDFWERFKQNIDAVVSWKK